MPEMVSHISNCPTVVLAATAFSLFHPSGVGLPGVLIALEPLSIKTFKTTERSGDNPQIENPGL